MRGVEVGGAMGEGPEIVEGGLGGGAFLGGGCGGAAGGGCGDGGRGVPGGGALRGVEFLIGCFWRVCVSVSWANRR